MIINDERKAPKDLLKVKRDMKVVKRHIYENLKEFVGNLESIFLRVLFSHKSATP